MYEDCLASLRMTRRFLHEGLFDGAVHHCKVIRYQPETDYLYLLAGKTELPTFSLDGIYECEIVQEETAVKCRGIICERYLSRNGKEIVFRVQSGFYKKNLN